ncbi:MAG: UDP-glucose/GDP-mannose dehydrogenase family protein, partial [Synergistaceae bacterium]|nr:UDP-glucose/GDP-mannose dehydrogenase family protein [Synergistaceae bacterium]
MVTVVGLGFVGLTTALGFAEYGHKVYGIEVNPARMETIKSGKLPFQEPGMDKALKKHLGKNFIPTIDWETAISDSDIVYYCVGTPYTKKGGEADLTYLFKAIEETLSAIHDEKFRVLVIKSTIPPSTTQKRIIPFLQEHNVKVPEQIGVANNPEFLREGHCWEDFTQADRIVIGVSDERTEKVLRELYAKEKAPICCVNLNTGEFIKYLSNTSLACLISFSNEMSLAADHIGEINVAEAFRILHMDKRWQTGTIRNYFYPGCGYGGYCLPKDTSAFYAVAKQSGYDGQILKNVIATNEAMPKATAKKIIHAANGNLEACIGILGLSFNAGSDDVRDTPSAKIIRELNNNGYKNIVAYDPIAIDVFHKSYDDVVCRFVESYDDILQQADLFAITTAWPEFAN